MSVYLNNKFIEDDQAYLHVSDLSIQRGYGIFDFLRTMDGAPLFMDDHLDRFYASADALHLPVKKSREELSPIIHELIKRSSLSEAGIRITLTGGYSTDSYQIAEPNLVITCNPVKISTQNDFEKGVSIITHEYQRELPHVKSINYLMAVWLQPLLKDKQADDLLYHRNNIITEFPRSNVFIVTAGNKLVTPARNVLKGITRKNILSLAKEIAQVEERDIIVEELSDAPEVFLTATTKKIMPVIRINNKMVGNGKPGTVTTKLYKKFLELERSAHHLVSR